MNRRLLVVTAALLALGVIADVATGAANFPGYGASIGLFGCVLIVFVSKWISGIVSRPEDFYPDDLPDRSDGPASPGTRGDAHG